MDESHSTAPADDARVVAYWHRIAPEWTHSIRTGGIPSRTLATNRAIVDAVLERSPASILDVGCGEGWLCREIARHGILVTGIDAVPELIRQAQAAGAGDYRVMTYDDLSTHNPDLGADVVVFNFSLLGKESVEELIHRASALMEQGGALIIQTLHPVLACGDEAYVDGWRRSPWTGISADMTDPSPWYFRTLGTWIQLFGDSSLRLVDLREPLHPETGQPASVIFILEPVPM